MRPRVILLGMLLLVGFGTYAQKVKYKDLYVLLRAKNYNDASGFLVTFLTQEPDHPNANYQMGLMLEHKLKELDLLKETDAIIARADSAILYFNKSHDLIDDKEVKKHDDEYYELFKRRNLRTGKFEVIVSDVQLDIEKRIEGLNTLKSQVAGVKGRFEKAMTLYEAASFKYEKLRAEFSDELTLAMGSTDSTFSTLRKMDVEYDSALINFKAYKQARSTFEGSDYEEIIIDVDPIENFSEEALSKPDFYSHKVHIFNFSNWSANMQAQIKSRREFVSNLIRFDETLDVMDMKIKTDSVDLSGEIFGMITSNVLKELKLVDYGSWLMNLFQYKIGQLNLHSVWMGWHTGISDTLDVGVQLSYLPKIKNQYEGVLKLKKGLEEYTPDPFTKRYHKFIEERFQTNTALEKYIKDQAGIVEQEGNEIEALEAQLIEKSKWAWWKQDSISLTSQNDSLAYATCFIDSLATKDFVIGGIYSNNETAQLYFGHVPTSRVIDTLFMAPIQGLSPQENTHSLSISGAKSQDGKYALLVWKSYENDDALLPPELFFADPQSGVLWSVKVDGVAGYQNLSVSEEGITVLPDQGEPQAFSFEGTKIDKAGQE